MSMSRAVKPVRTSVQRAVEHQSGICPVQLSGKDVQEENQAVCQIAQLLIIGVVRTRWAYALYDALDEAQRVEARAEREHLARAFKELSH